MSLITNAFMGRRLPENRLPSTIRIKLDKRFPGWRFAQISVEIRDAMKEYVSLNSQLDLIKGDFDGNGQLDYALLIEQGDIFNDTGAVVGRNNHIVAFLKRGNDYSLHLVDSNAGDYLLLWRKGDQGYSYESQRNIVFDNDAMEAVIFEKAGTSYVYKKGKFLRIITGD
jgi:hypothetical protein